MAGDIFRQTKDMGKSRVEGCKFYNIMGYVILLSEILKQKEEAVSVSLRVSFSFSKPPFLKGPMAYSDAVTEFFFVAFSC